MRLKKYYGYCWFKILQRAKSFTARIKKSSEKSSYEDIMALQEVGMVKY